MSLYQHILFLLTLLTLVSGCTQLPPPKIGVFDQMEDEAQVVDTQNPDPVVKPSGSKPDAGTGSAVVLNGELSIYGQDAEMILQALAVEGVSEKRGKHIVCEKQGQGSAVCRLKFEIENGSVMVQENQPGSSVATPMDQDYSSDHLYFNKSNTMGQVTLMGAVARTIFTEMTRPIGFFDLNADDTHLPGVRKKGQNIDCYEQYLKASPQDPIHTCYLYFLNRSAGEFDSIQ
jgi:hypothetical protein